MPGIPLKTESSTRHRDRTALVAGWFAIVLSAAEVILDLGTWADLDIATIYGIPLVLAAFTRDRRLLWGLMTVLVLVTFIAYALQIPSGSFALREALFVNRALDAIALLLIAGLLDIWMASLDVRDSQARLLHEQNSRLEAGNALLVAHEARVVQQNEVLSRRQHEAEQASDRKTRLLNAVSHDMRNPANTIYLIAEVIRRSAEDPALVTNLSRMAERLQANARGWSGSCRKCSTARTSTRVFCNVTKVRSHSTNSSKRSARTSPLSRKRSHCTRVARVPRGSSPCAAIG